MSLENCLTLLFARVCQGGADELHTEHEGEGLLMLGTGSSYEIKEHAKGLEPLPNSLGDKFL